MKISVIVPCRNESRHICEFMNSLLAQDLDKGWEIEILVADGMSDDGTRELIRQYGEKMFPVRMIDNPARIVSSGLNAAIEASEGDIIIRMDAHTTYANDYIRQCVTVLEDSGADCVGGPWVARGRGLVGKAIAAAFRSPFGTGGGKAHDPDYEGDVDTVYLGCWRRSVFSRVGLFDQSLVRNQDDEFNFRLRRAGGRVWQSPRISSSYSPRASIKALFRQYLQYGFWKVAVIRKHRALASWRHAVPALFVGSALSSLALLALAWALGMPQVAAAVRTAVALGLGVYLVASIIAALPYAGNLDPRTLLILPAVIAVYHVAYGVGFLMGIFSLGRRRPHGAAHSRLFTALTR